MSRREECANLLKVKTALAAKYHSLARVRRSKPARARLIRLSEAYANQAAILSAKLKD